MMRETRHCFQSKKFFLLSQFLWPEKLMENLKENQEIDFILTAHGKSRGKEIH